VETAPFARLCAKFAYAAGCKEVHMNWRDDTMTRLRYLYGDEELYYFMDNETYEQLPLEKEQVEDALPYLKENMNVTIRFFKGQAFDVSAPNFVTLQVVATEPGARGDTATNVQKPATLETGYVVSVPLFINQGEMIRIDTRTGEYMERA